MTAEVTVIIPVHGSVEPVLALIGDLATIAAGRPEGGPPILVVDDASPTQLPTDALPGGVRLVRREANGGFGAAVNTGLEHVETPLALVLNSDLRVPAGFVQQIVEHAAPFQPAIVGCRNADADGGSGYAARFFPTVVHQVVEWLRPLAALRDRDALHRAVGHDLAAERGRGMVPVDWVSGAVLLLPVAEVLAAGGFDEGYFMYTEEVDLQVRLRERGVPAFLDADLSVVHAGGGSASSELRRRRWLLGARARYARRHGHPGLLRSGLTLASGVNLLWNSARRVAGRDVHPLAELREELFLIHRAGRELPR